MESENEKSPAKKRRIETKIKEDKTPVKRKRLSDNSNKDLSDVEGQLPIQKIEDITPVKKKRKTVERSDDIDLSDGEDQLPIQKIEDITPEKKKSVTDVRSDDINKDLSDDEDELPVQKIKHVTPVKKKRRTVERSDDIDLSDGEDELPIQKIEDVTPVKKKRKTDERSDNINNDSSGGEDELPIQKIEDVTPVKKKRKTDERSDDINKDLSDGENELPIQKIEDITPVKKKRETDERSVNINKDLSDGEDQLPSQKIENITPVKKKRQTDERSDDNNKDLGDGEDQGEVPIQEIEKHIEFTDILQDIDDLNEPACMDKILMYLEEIKDEDYFFMELLVDRLKGEVITWEQPWYQQSNSLSRPLKNADDSKHTQSYRTDTICKAECEKIQENWNEFRELYEVPDKLICLARWKNKDKSRLPNTPEERARRFVVAYLARGLQRTMFQIFRHIMTHFGGSAKGAYSADEEKIMKVCFKHHPNHSVTLLSMVLRREPRGIYKRLQQLFNGKPEKKKIRWTLTLATRFLRLLLKYTQLPLEDLKNRKIDKSVWLKLAKKFEHHYVYLQNFWYGSLHVQVFVKENLKINKLRKNVFKSLKSSSYQVWTDIRWKDLVKQFHDGLTHRFLYQICRGVVCKIPDYLKKPLSEIADQALDKLQKHQYRKRRLKTLQMNEDGDLQPVRYDS